MCRHNSIFCIFSALDIGNGQQFEENASPSSSIQYTSLIDADDLASLIDHDATTDEVVALEVWEASKRLPQAVLDALGGRDSDPPAPHSAAA